MIPRGGEEPLRDNANTAKGIDTFSIQGTLTHRTSHQNLPEASHQRHATGPPLHFVVARHREDLTWLWGFLEDHPGCSATVFNDGPAIEGMPLLSARVSVKAGDGVPSEPTKYISFMLEHWGDGGLAPGGAPGQRLVFTQADPFEHR